MLVDGVPLNSCMLLAVDVGARKVVTVEGLAHGETLAGERVMIIDDVATSGGSIIKAAEVARAAGAVVETALVIIDREEGATEALQKAGIRLLSVLRTQDFL